jgi:hypothetical protein
VFVFPNPSSGQRAFSFQAAEAGSFTVSVFTVTGRKIWSGSGTASQGYNQVVWDGMDTDGDQPASGAYIYRVELHTLQSGTGTFTDVLAVIR